jgi:hypothetical protein
VIPAVRAVAPLHMNFCLAKNVINLDGELHKEKYITVPLYVQADLTLLSIFETKLPYRTLHLPHEE